MDFNCQEIRLTLVDGKKPKSAKTYDFTHIAKNKSGGYLFYTDSAKQSLAIETKGNALILQIYMDS